jgi:hypothetical protein
VFANRFLLGLVGLEVFCIAKRPQTPKGDSRGNRGRRIAFLSPFIPLENPPESKKLCFFSWERKPLVSSPNLSFLKGKIHFVNEKFNFPLLASFLITMYAKCLGSLAFSALSSTCARGYIIVGNYEL